MNSWSLNYIVDKGGNVAESTEGLRENIKDPDLSCILPGLGSISVLAVVHVPQSAQHSYCTMWLTANVETAKRKWRFAIY